MITQLKKGTLELCVLSLLNQKDMYGYELVTKISEDIEITVGTIYPLMKRIKEEGYVETQTVDSPNGPSRKYYHLTEAGKQILEENIKEWKAFSEKINRMIGGYENESN